MTTPRTDAGNDAGDLEQEAERERERRVDDALAAICPWCGRGMTVCLCTPDEAPF